MRVTVRPAAAAEPATETDPAERPASHRGLAAPPRRSPPWPRPTVKVAAVERGRIASLGGVTALIWLVILVLMVWH